MSGLFLTCCVRGLEVTRHFTPELGHTISVMLGVALLAGVLLLVGLPLLRLRGSRL